MNGRVGGVLGACIALAVGLAGCGRPDEADERPSRLVEIVTPEGCTLSPIAPRQMTGAYLRETDGAGIFDAVILRGLDGTNALPADPRVDDRPVRPRPTGVLGRFINTRPATATPVEGLSVSGGPRGYRLDFVADGLSHTGLAVVGETPAGSEVPSVGQIRVAGPAVLVERSADGEDRALTGRVEAVVGFGSGTVEVRLSDVAATDGGAVPFSAVTWTGLGLCGTRIVSTGRGSVRVTGPDGRILLPFGAAGVQSTLNGFLEAGDAPGRAPQGAGGVLLLQGDAASLRGGFALRAGN